MTKDELIRLKNELDYKYNIDNNDRNSLGFGPKRMSNPEKEEKTEKLVSDIENILAYIVTSHAANGHKLDELQIDYLLYVLTEKDKEEEFLHHLYDIVDADEETKYNYLKENVSGKYFLCQVIFKGSDYINDVYHYHREFMKLEEFIDIDKFISLIKNLGYDLKIGKKDINNGDDYIRFFAKDSLGSAYLNTVIDFEKENENDISLEDEFYDKIK